MLGKEKGTPEAEYLQVMKQKRGHLRNDFMKMWADCGLALRAQ